MPQGMSYIIIYFIYLYSNFHLQVFINAVCKLFILSPNRIEEEERRKREEEEREQERLEEERLRKEEEARQAERLREEQQRFV